MKDEFSCLFKSFFYNGDIVKSWNKWYCLLFIICKDQICCFSRYFLYYKWKFFYALSSSFEESFFTIFRVWNLFYDAPLLQHSNSRSSENVFTHTTIYEAFTTIYNRFLLQPIYIWMIIFFILCRKRVNTKIKSGIQNILYWACYQCLWTYVRIPFSEHRTIKSMIGDCWYNSKIIISWFKQRCEFNILYFIINPNIVTFLLQL